jgi:hypothetical protein
MFRFLMISPYLSFKLLRLIRFLTKPYDKLLQLIPYVVKYGRSGSVFNYVRVTINNGILVQDELYSRLPSKLVGKLVSKPELIYVASILQHSPIEVTISQSVPRIV